jgi:hypothetical protein
LSWPPHPSIRRSFDVLKPLFDTHIAGDDGQVRGLRLLVGQGEARGGREQRKGRDGGRARVCRDARACHLW